MLIADVPDAPPSTPPVVILAQSNSSQQVAAQQDHILGVCDLVELIKSGQAELAPLVNADWYFNTTTIKFSPTTAKITVLQQPEHGYLKPDSRGDWAFAKYIPNDDFVSGNDSFVIQVEDNGLKVKIHYFMSVTEAAGDTNTNPVCQGQNRVWKISQDTNGNPTLTLLAQPASATPDTLTSDSLSAWLSLAQLDAKIADMTSLMSSINVGSSQYKRGQIYLPIPIHQPASVTSANLASLPGPPL